MIYSYICLLYTSVVRTCAEGTPFVTLDGVERKLTADDLMICSAERPMCIAGVFGGLDSGIGDTTVSYTHLHVILHQTVIGQEAVAQMEMADAEPDVVIGCFGGGSNFAGLGFPFLRKNLTEGKKIRIVAVEPSSCPKLTRGSFQYDFGDVAGFTPLLPMYTLGHDFQMCIRDRTQLE